MDVPGFLYGLMMWFIWPHDLIGVVIRIVFAVLAVWLFVSTAQEESSRS